MKQADLMYLDLTESGLSLDEAVQRISDQVAMDATNYDGFRLVVVDGNGRFSEFQINKKELVESSFLGGPGLSSRTQSPGDGIPLGNSTIASKPDSVKGTPFELAEDTPSMAEVRRKYEGTDQWMKAPGGELVAVHWMGGEYLDKAIKEGLPMPSIAITKHDNTELRYGEVAFIGGRTLAQRLLVDGHIYNDDAYTVPRPDSTNKQANPAQPMSAQHVFDLMAPEQNDLDRSLPPGVRRITSWDDLKQQGSHAHGYPAVQGEASTYQLKTVFGILQARLGLFTTPDQARDGSNLMVSSQAWSMICMPSAQWLPMRYGARLPLRASSFPTLWSRKSQGSSRTSTTGRGNISKPSPFRSSMWETLKPWLFPLERSMHRRSRRCGMLGSR